MTMMNPMTPAPAGLGRDVEVEEGCGVALSEGAARCVGAPNGRKGKKGRDEKKTGPGKPKKKWKRKCHRRPQGRPGGKPEYGLRSKRVNEEVVQEDLFSGRCPSRLRATRAALSVEITRHPSTHREWALLLPVRGRLGKRS
jgi:hypothetical protein